jgi:hypothetical protein
MIMFHSYSSQEIAFIGLLVWLAVGFVVVTFLEMKVSGVKLRELGKTKLGDKAFFLRSGNLVMIWAFLWPMAVAFAKLAIKQRNEEKQPTP